MIKETIFLRLVHDFYFNTNVANEKNLIVSNLKGTEVRVTPKIIGHVLGLPVEGASLYGENWYKFVQIRRYELV
jgi:hypothetical protein